MTTKGGGQFLAAARNQLASRRFPLALALAAVLLMSPALGTGLFLDDLVQRVIQFRPEALPERLLDTGFVSSDSGKLGTVLCDLFGFPRHPEAAARARDYGTVSWWVPDGMKAALWRPFTAFTHWLDYRIYPDTPALMHAHNIAWFAAAVFLVAVLYRQIGAFAAGSGLGPTSAGSAGPSNRSAGLAVAGVGAVLFLLDKDTYFPVMFVANRGFIIALVFGLLCLGCHHLWRTTGSTVQLGMSVLWFALSLLANEGGASTLAFLGAYALVLESGSWRARCFSLLPVLTVLVIWRFIYMQAGFGVRMLEGYIDPGYEPGLFLKNLPSRLNALLGGQLSGIPPEAMVLLHPRWQTALAVFFAAFNVVCIAALLPMLRRDRGARFWAVAAALALVPAATVVPLTKNMAFIAVGAFGAIAPFLCSAANTRDAACLRWPTRGLVWVAAVWLVIAHTLGALTGRAFMAMAGPFIPKVTARWCEFEQFPEIGGRTVVFVGNPSPLSTIATPFQRAYHNLPLPASIRILAAGMTGFEVSRPDPATLILKAGDSDLFDAPALGPVHESYLFKAVHDFLAGGRTWKAGDRVARKGMDVEVLAVSPRGMPSKVSFRFEGPLETGDRVWLVFDWKRNRYARFQLPLPGETVQVPGVARYPFY